MRIYGLKTCDTCRAAVKAATKAGHVPTFIDVRATPLADDDIARFLAAFGEALVNRRSTTWRGLDEAERAEKPSALLAQHPTLMKRPVIEVDKALHLGWTAEVRAALGLG
ncbi:MAG: ArsC/Spx/MgsR family protein [Pseudomonadota bacterium]